MHVSGQYWPFAVMLNKKIRLLQNADNEDTNMTTCMCDRFKSKTLLVC